MGFHSAVGVIHKDTLPISLISPVTYENVIVAETVNWLQCARKITRIKYSVAVDGGKKALNVVGELCRCQSGGWAGGCCYSVLQHVFDKILILCLFSPTENGETALGTRYC